MRRIILACSVFLTACSSSDNEHRYYYHDQWKLPGEDRALRDEPKEVSDSTFTNLTDTIVLSATGEFEKAEVTRFDQAGNMIVHRSVRPDFTIVQQSVYTDTGYSTKTYSESDRNLTDTFGFTLRPFKEGKFISTARGSDVVPPRYISFSDGGNVRVTETIDSSGGRVLTTTQTEYFKNGQRQKIVSRKDSAEQQVVYYYTANALDSIVFFADGKWQSKRIYINNDQGDPVYWAEIRMLHEGMQLRDTLQAYSASYVYDKNGNWVRRLQREIVAPSNLPSYLPVDPAQKFPGYTLTVRKLVYR